MWSDVLDWLWPPRKWRRLAAELHEVVELTAELEKKAISCGYADLLLHMNEQADHIIAALEGRDDGG